MNATKPTNADRFEGLVLVLILLAVGAMAAAASFTHIHDWTMRNAPTGTGDWFGWANAMISDLVPLGVGLEVRRRRRIGAPVGWYPIVVIGAAALLSLAGQLAQAKPGPSGWLLAAVPALGFFALTKLVLSRPSTPAGTDPVPVPDRPEAAEVIVPDQDDSSPALPGDLLDAARAAAQDYQQATGRDITRDALREALRVSNATASDLLRAVRDDTGTRINGYAIGSGVVR